MWPFYTFNKLFSFPYLEKPDYMKRPKVKSKYMPHQGKREKERRELQLMKADNKKAGY